MAATRRILPPAKNPPLRGWTPEISRLTDIIDVLIRVNSADPAAFTGLARPLTGIDFLEKRERNERLSRVVAKANPINDVEV